MKISYLHKIFLNVVRTINSKKTVKKNRIKKFIRVIIIIIFNSKLLIINHLSMRLLMRLSKRNICIY